MMRDAGGNVWRCIRYRDGTVGELKVTNAIDDGGGGMTGNPAREGGGGTTTRQVRFASGASSATYDGSVAQGNSTCCVLGARKGPFLTVRIELAGPDISYQILNSDQSPLLDMMTPDKTYRGQLWQSGDQLVEVINSGDRTERYRIDFGIG
ncbi:hypothetical protein [Kaistia adipata]|uniref:hypothetical protein n=1 Tax=Kaistia adipata TaxID=166954 RepID=UPI0012EB4158|nr:hypothetical protein [Kaistia adipata]